MKQIYDLTAGIPAYIVKVIQEAQIQAILMGKEKLSYEVIKESVSLLGIDVPKYYACNGTSISDFTVREVETESFESISESCLSAQAYTQLSVLPESSTQPMEPVRRYFATKRGRPGVKRDSTDLIVLWKTEKELTKKLESLDLLERRCL